MAGGEGSRLRPLTIGRPKPMVPIANKPVMEYIIELLKRHGITDIVVTLQYLPGVIQDYFGDGSAFGVNLTYAVEDRPLGTAGSVKNAIEHLTDTFLVISGDAVTDIDISEVIAFHRARQAMATLTLYRVPNPLEYGVVIIAEDGRVKQFLEKPSWGEVISDTVNTGLYVLDPAVLDLAPKGEQFDFSQQLFPHMLTRGDPMYGFVAGGYWCDVGNIGEYLRASHDILTRKVQVAIAGVEQREGLWAAAGAKWSPEAEIMGPVLLGRDALVRAGAVIHGPSVVGDYSIIDTHALVERSIIWSNSYVGNQAHLAGAMVGRQCDIRTGAVLLEGSVVGDSTVIGDGAIVQSDVKVWPNKELDAGVILNESLIWGGSAHRSLFGAYGVSGLVNVDVTPEFAAQLGAAYGAVLEKQSIVTVNRDPHRSPRMIKRAMIAGLPSAGANVRDVQTLPIPVARYVTRHSDAAGGVHVRISPFDDRLVDIKFFDAQGLDLDKPAERKIENTFFRQDFRRVYLDELGAIDVDTQAGDAYVRAFLATIDAQAIQRANFRVVIDYSHGSSALVFPSILAKLGCDVVAINSSVDELRMFRTGEQFEEELRQLASITAALHFDLGVRIDLGGEKMFVTDSTGRQLARMSAFGAMAELYLRQHPGESLAAPVTAPRLFDRLAEAHGSRLVRTPVSVRALTAAALAQGVGLAGDGDGGFIFPTFLPAFDAMMATARLMELLAEQGDRLVDIVDALPRYWVNAVDVPCSWELKGRVMRLLNEQYRQDGEEQLDGIKVNRDDWWALVLPDADRPVFHVLAEGRDQAHADQLTAEWASVVRELAS